MPTDDVERRRAERRPRSGWAAGIAVACWLLYAAWEGYLLIFLPQANIRIDLLFIWPLLGLVTLWAAVVAWRGRRRR